MNTLYFDAVIRPKFNLGDSDTAAVAEAIKFANIQLGILDRHLADSDWLASNSLSIADLFAFAYLEQHREVHFPIDEYANVKAWFDRVESRASIADARAKLPS
jgi:glutathione S-transferase